MAVIRHRWEHQPFVCFVNEVAQDDRLSFAARGLLLYMCSLPPHWDFSAERLARQSPKAWKEGPTTIRRCMRELRQRGYLLEERQRDERGRIRTVYTVCNEPVPEWMTSDDTASPQVAPDAGQPNSAGPGPGSPESNRKNTGRKNTARKNTGSGLRPAPTAVVASSDFVGTDLRRRGDDDGRTCCDLRARVESLNGHWAQLGDSYGDDGSDRWLIELLGVDPLTHLDHNDAAAFHAMCERGNVKAAVMFFHSRTCTGTST
jgi:hypothetical protein